MIKELFDALREAMPTGIPVFLGRRHLADRGAPPRIVVVPGSEQFTTGRSNRDAAGNYQKSVATRVITLNVHVWAGDIPKVDALVQQLVLAMRGAAGSGRIGTGQWLTQEEAGWLTAGEAYVLPLEFDTPITAPTAYVTLEEIATKPGPAIP